MARRVEVLAAATETEEGVPDLSPTEEDLANLVYPTAVLSVEQVRWLPAQPSSCLPCTASRCRLIHANDTQEPQLSLSLVVVV